jgi:hypothetical protein
MQQLADVKGLAISEYAAIVDRIEGVLERIEAAFGRNAAENARLKRVEAAAVATLADLDAMIGDDGDGDNAALAEKAG